MMMIIDNDDDDYIRTLDLNESEMIIGERLLKVGQTNDHTRAATSIHDTLSLRGLPLPP